MLMLIYGGNGFIGQHVARYLSDQGEHVVVTAHSRPAAPVLLAEDIAAGRVIIEPVDITDPFAVMGVVAKHRPRVVIDLSGHAPKALATRRDVAFRTSAWLNILESARLTHVSRVVMMSSMDSYWGLDASQAPFHEDAPVPLVEQNDHFIVQSWVKKALEVIGSLYRRQHGMDVVFPRAGGVYGPLYRTFLNWPSRVVRAAVRGGEEFDERKLPFAEEGYDQTYVKDIAEGISLIARAKALRHVVYNIGSGRVTTCGEFANAVQAVEPGFAVKLPSRVGHASPPPAGAMDGRWMDISRAREELGYAPKFTVDAAIADYVAWMRSHDF